MRYYINILVLLITAVLCGELYSQSMDSVVTGEIVVESNRVRMTNSTAPNKIQVMDRLFLSSLNGTSLPDALKLSDAVYIKDYGFNSGTKTISLNATQSEHTLILLNGIRLNSSQNAQVDLSLYDLDNVERIEISKGGSSALYGSEAIGGVINIITKTNVPAAPFGFTLKAGLGSYGQKNIFGRFSQGFRLKGTSTTGYSISFSDNRAKNDFDYYLNSGVYKVLRNRENSDYNTQSFDADVTYSESDKLMLKLFANYTHFERGVPGIDIGYATGTARQIDKNIFTGASLFRRVSGVLTMKSTLGYRNALQKYFDPATFGFSSPINSFYRLNNYSASNVFSFVPEENYSFDAGAEVSFSNITSNETDEGKQVQAAAFWAAKFEFLRKGSPVFTIYPTVRYDHFSNINTKNVVTGKLGVNIKPFAAADLHFKSSFGNNFSAPTFNELYWKDIGNPKLKPERSISFDAGIYYRLNLAAEHELEISYYNINTTDRILWTPESAAIWKPINVGKVRSEGIDVSLRSVFSLSKRLTTQTAINYTFGSALKKNEDYPGDPSYNKQLIYLPKEMLKASIMLNYLTTSKFIKFVSFSLFYNFSTRRYTNFENTEFIPRYDVLDGNIGLGFQAGDIEVGLKFIANNLLNESYSVLPGYPMPLRNFKTEINIKY
ncbi:MAG: TonB-dependent receptor [Ignavibacteria bacterium]|nr:TonB-dependent receptor [Ignavibacteria bacterium]